MVALVLTSVSWSCWAELSYWDLAEALNWEARTAGTFSTVLPLDVIL